MALRCRRASSNSGRWRMSLEPPEPGLLRIRAALADDAGAVRACVVAAFEPYIARIGKPPGPMLVDFPRRIEEGAVWLAEQAGRVDGVLVLYETADGFYLDTVAVSPACHGSGVGRALLMFAEREALRRGFASIYLCTNAKMVENQTLYPKAGYVEFARRADGGYDRVFYRKQLG